ncbi:MAG: TolC family protein [Limnobacter sp.]|nr:TolC family protein [Limnobacter sp.]
MPIIFTTKCTTKLCLSIALLAGTNVLAQTTNASAPQQALEQSLLKAFIESAWERSSSRAQAKAQSNEVQAYQQIASSWRAGPSRLGLAYEADQSSNRNKDGSSEYETTLSTPVWGVVQRTARQEVSSAMLQVNDAQLVLRKLEVAGLVRQLYWEVAAKSLVCDELRDHIQHLKQTEELVAKRVKAGDLAPSDLLLAQQEVRQSEVDLKRAMSQEIAMQAEFAALTGLPWRPNDGLPTVLEATDLHPKLANLKAEITKRQAKLEIPSESADIAPKFGLLLRQESSDFSPTRQRVGVQLEFPLGTDVINKPARYALQTELAGLEAQLRLETEALSKRIASAERAIELQREGLVIAEEHLKLATGHLALIQKAFDLGDKGLVQLLRSQASAHSAKISHMQQGVYLAQAISNLNQIKGLLP